MARFLFRMKKKAAIEMGFSWIFAIIVGGIILLFAVYAASKIIGVGEYKSNTDAGAKLAFIFNPLGTGMSSGKYPEIIFKKDSKIYLECNDRDNKPFGKQEISFSEKSMGNKYGEIGEGIEVKNQYIFSEDIVEGKELNVFSKPFLMPFKIADIVMLSMGEYCFYQTPSEIKEEIEELELKNVKFVNNLNADGLSNCTGKLVCFESENNKCEINVQGNCVDYECDSEYDYGFIEKENKKIYYSGNLIYAGIFSSPLIYECNVKRLMNRFCELSLIYRGKVVIEEANQCDASIGEELKYMCETIKSLSSGNKLDSGELIELYHNGKEVDSMNQALSGGCRLY